MSTLPLAHILSLWSMKSLLKPALFTTSVLKWDALKTEIGIRRQRGMHVDENWWYFEFFAPGAGVFSFLPSANMSCCLWSRRQLFCVGCLSCPARIFFEIERYEWWLLLCIIFSCCPPWILHRQSYSSLYSTLRLCRSYPEGWILVWQLYWSDFFF